MWQQFIGEVGKFVLLRSESFSGCRKLLKSFFLHGLLCAIADNLFVICNFSTICTWTAAVHSISSPSQAKQLSLDHSKVSLFIISFLFTWLKIVDGSCTLYWSLCYLLDCSDGQIANQCQILNRVYRWI